MYQVLPIKDEDAETQRTERRRSERNEKAEMEMCELSKAGNGTIVACYFLNPPISHRIRVRVRVRV